MLQLSLCCRELIRGREDYLDKSVVGVVGVPVVNGTFDLRRIMFMPYLFACNIAL